MEALTFRRGSYCSLHPLTPPPSPHVACSIFILHHSLLGRIYLSVCLSLPQKKREEKRRRLIFRLVRRKLPHAYTAVCVCVRTIYFQPPCPRTQHASQQPATQEEMEPVVQSGTMVASMMHRSRLSVGGPRETHLLPARPADRNWWRVRAMFGSNTATAWPPCPPVRGLANEPESHEKRSLGTF